MQKKIAIITSGHPPFDERIYNKFAYTFSKYNYKTIIISSFAEIRQEENNIEILGFYGNNLTKRKKIFKFAELLEKYSPDVIICSEPLTILAASIYRKKNPGPIKIISDITEWYPENVAFKKNGIKRFVSYIVLYLFNLFTSNLADKFIVGENGKLKRYNLIAPTKDKRIIGYYPPLKYFSGILSKTLKQNFIVCFSGIISKERGIYNVLKVMSLLKERDPGTEIKLRVIGKFESEDDKKMFEANIKTMSIQLEMVPWTYYADFPYQLEDVHVCIDLREKNFIYNNSLPIKIFDYLACGKPIIYSDIKPLLNEKFIESVGFLVNPDDTLEVVKRLEIYLNDRNLLEEHSKNARKLFENNFNWEKIEQNLIDFLGDD
ncbi:MAG: glycosyltransferase [Ignavibacteriales bacterium]|nr:MAG: glycosyltransferase [Ignavibacteriales bacterium]